MHNLVKYMQNLCKIRALEQDLRMMQDQLMHDVLMHDTLAQKGLMHDPPLQKGLMHDTPLVGRGYNHLCAHSDDFS